MPATGKMYAYKMQTKTLTVIENVTAAVSSKPLASH